VFTFEDTLYQPVGLVMFSCFAAQSTNCFCSARFERDRVVIAGLDLVS
jgi:hypothetical protein